jgi:hypothetical protein
MRPDNESCAHAHNNMTHENKSIRMRQELVVVQPLETQPATEQEQVLVCFAALIWALQDNVLSGDTWWLSHHAAKRAAAELGVSVEVYEAVMRKLEVARKAKRHPMASMFS